MLVTPLVLIQISARECRLTGQNAGLTLETRVTWHVCSKPHHRYLSRSELHTTETELSAMAALAIQGCSCTPTGASTPAAMGIPTVL